MSRSYFMLDATIIYQSRDKPWPIIFCISLLCSATLLIITEILEYMLAYKFFSCCKPCVLYAGYLWGYSTLNWFGYCDGWSFTNPAQFCICWILFLRYLHRFDSCCLKLRINLISAHCITNTLLQNSYFIFC